MKSTLPTLPSVIVLILAFAAICGFLGWKMFVASEREVNSDEIQQRLKWTMQAVISPSNKGNPDDDLRVYAVNVVHTAVPFRKPFFGYGVYLGQGTVLTAAHVVGHIPIVTHPRVLISGKDLPAKVTREDSKENIDLALLSIDESLLPYTLRLRRNPICKEPLQAGLEVLIVYPERTVRSKVISPVQAGLTGYAQFNTLVDKAEGSGSGVFDRQRKCLLGIISRKVEKNNLEVGRTRFAGYFVPAQTIRAFINGP